MQGNERVKKGSNGCNGIFLSIKDLMLLNGSESYNSTQREHAAIRNALEMENPKIKKRLRGRLPYIKRRITIREYCDYMQLDFEEVWKFLRGDEEIDDED